VNYLGHAAVASWRSRESAFVLGAMLPDFATMIGARPPTTAHAGLEAGMRFHHRTDEVFHRSAAFVELTRAAFAWLLARGVERGQARAVAHVGVELLLDAELTRDEPVRRAYLAAVESATPHGLGGHLSWTSPRDPAGFEALRERLLARGVIAGEADAASVGRRLRQALGSRPRLALDDAAEVIARDWVVAARRDVAERAGALARELAERLR
jgi:hypothetical protein